MGFLDNAGLTRLWAKCKSRFSPIGHTHVIADITDFSSSGGGLSEDEARDIADAQIASAATISRTAAYSVTNSSTIYLKVNGFGGMGYGKGFNCILGSRAGETILFTINSNDSDYKAYANRLFNTYSKINAIHYVASEQAFYCTMSAWCNFLSVTIISNSDNDRSPAIASVSSIPSGAVGVTIEGNVSSLDSGASYTYTGA